MEELEVFDCPICHGPGLVQEEQGWCVYVECLDCGCHTAELAFHSEEERMKQTGLAVSLWNVGKVIRGDVGE